MKLLDVSCQHQGADSLKARIASFLCEKARLTCRLSVAGWFATSLKLAASHLAMLSKVWFDGVTPAGSPRVDF